MLTRAVIAHFGTRAAAAQWLGISASAVSQWGERVPPFQARRLHGVGSLNYDPAEYVGRYPSYRHIPPAIEAA